MRPRLWHRGLVIYGLAAIVGVAAGLGAVLFEYLSSAVSWFALGRGLGYAPAGPHGEPHLFGNVPAHEILAIGLLVVPAVGGLLASMLCRRFAPEASGHGTDAVIDAYHHRDGFIRPRVPLIKALATAITLGTGGSGGREGPIAQIGAGFGSWLGGVFHVSARQRRILVAAGMGAGVGAIFRAPLAGALFASEILYRQAEIEGEAIMPSFIACSVSYCVFCGWFQDFGTLFRLKEGFVFTHLSELLPYTVLALLLVPAVAAFTKLFYGLEHVFARIPGPRPLVAALGGLLCGGTALIAWKTLGDAHALGTLSQGYGVLQSALDGGINGWDGVRLLLVIGVLKMLTTSFTISSGGSAGVFGPAMVVGGSIGGAVGLAGAQAGWVSHPGCFVIVGMCGFFAGAANTPISTIIMVCEMTGSYDLLLPAMWVCGLSFLLSQRWTLYAKQVANRGMSPAHKGEYIVPLLEGLRVADVLETDRPLASVPADMPLSAVLRLVARTQADYFPVLDEEQRFVGIFSAYDVRQFTYEESLHDVACAMDLMTTDPIVLHLEDDLHVALDKFAIKDLDELPVVAADDDTRLVGMLRRRAVARAYKTRLDALRAQPDD